MKPNRHNRKRKNKRINIILVLDNHLLSNIIVFLICCLFVFVSPVFKREGRPTLSTVRFHVCFFTVRKCLCHIDLIAWDVSFDCVLLPINSVTGWSILESSHEYWSCKFKSICRNSSQNSGGYTSLVCQCDVHEQNSLRSIFHSSMPFKTAIPLAIA